MSTPSVIATMCTLDLASPNFGIQEETFFDDKTREVFPGCPEIKGGYMYSQ